VDLPGGTITLYDPKGARTQPRVHMLPLTETTVEIIQRRLDAIQLANDEVTRSGRGANLLSAGSTWLFSTDYRTAMREETISGLVKDVSAEMVKAGEAREPFQLRDLRRTAETMLAKLGTGPNIRGEVQSHGLGGVQKRHYDQHDYLEEKRAMLQLWASHLAALRAGTAIGQTAMNATRHSSTSLKKAAAELAASDGVSLNHFIAGTVPEKIRSLRAADDFLSEGAGTAKPKDMLKYLRRAPKVAPSGDDTL
jgi:hypothetical protein